MKKLSFILALCLTTGLWAQTQHVVEVESDIDEVVVFLEGAQITRKANTALKQGLNKVVFYGITHMLDATSIRVSSGNQGVILSVSGRQAIITNPKKAPIIKMLEDSLVTLRYRLDQELNTRYVLEQQESLLLENKDLKGDKGVVLIDLEDALLIYQKQLSTLKQGQLDSRRNEARLRERITILQNQLDEFKKGNQEPTYEITVIVSAPKNINSESFQIAYFVGNCTWVPSYDIRVKDLISPIIMQYKADVYNNSGENWESVKLSLSSGNPTSGGNAPSLSPQYVNYYTPVVKRENNAPRTRGARPAEGQTYYINGVRVVGGNDVNVNVVESTTSFFFEIPSRMRVIADNLPQNIDLTQHELKGDYQHKSVPKMEQETYLIARITGWESLNLLPGVASLYFEGTFLGKTDLDPRITADTLNISLGKDKGVVIERKQLTDFSSTSIVGGKKRQVFVYEITVRNTKKEAVEIRIEDQIPVSMNKDITVTPINLADAEQDEESGKLSWIKRLQPNESIVIRFEYELKYPKDRVLSGL